MKKLWMTKVLALLAALFIYGAEAQGSSIYIDATLPSSIKPGQEFNVSIIADVGTDNLKSYYLPLNFDDSLLTLERVTAGSRPEFNMPLTEKVPFFNFVRVWDENNLTPCNNASGTFTLLNLTFRVNETAPPNVVASISLNTGVKFTNCGGQDISPTFPFPQLNVNIVGLVAGSSGMNKFMDLNGDGNAAEEDAILMHKVVELDVVSGETSLLAINGRQADVRGNALGDIYDAGRMDALLRPARAINAGPNGVCEYEAILRDDIAEVLPGNGEPFSVVIEPGFNYFLDTLPLGDDVISGSRILSGPDGIADTFASGDDVQVVPELKGLPFGLCISPGPDQVIDTTIATGADDIIVQDPKNLEDFMTRKPQKGVPAKLKLISPRQNPLILNAIESVPITVAVLDENDRPKTGISPVFTRVSGGFFMDGLSGSTMVANIETDRYSNKDDAARGEVTVNFAPISGINVIEISLPPNPAMGIPAPTILSLSIIVDTSIQYHVNSINLMAQPTQAYVGDTVQLMLTVKDGATGVHGVANRLRLISQHNLSGGMSLTPSGQDRPQTIFFDDFETGDLSGGGQGPWIANPAGGQLNVVSNYPGDFGQRSLMALDSGNTVTAAPTIYRSVNTMGFEDIELSYQWAFFKNSSLPAFNVHFTTQYSTNGTTWRTLRDSTGTSDLLNGEGVWMYDHFSLKGAKALNNNVLWIKFIFDVGRVGSTQNIYLDNVSVTGMKNLFKEDFESYSVGEFPASMDPMNFINTGADGVRDTPVVLDDYSLFEFGNGLPFVRVISSGPDGTRESSPAFDDEPSDQWSINSGPNGIADTLAAPTDFQEIPVGHGKPFSLAILPGPNNHLESVPQGDDQIVGAMGPYPRVAVDSTVYPTSGGNQGHDGSQKFLFIGRAMAGSTVEKYQAGLIVNLGPYEQATLTFYSRSPSQADPGEDGSIVKPAQDFSVQVSDNGGKSWVAVWSLSGRNEQTWTKHEIKLFNDGRFNLVDGFMVRFQASMDSKEDNPADPDGVYIDDIEVRASEPVPESFSPIIDTNDGEGHYTASMSSFGSGGTVQVSAIYWPDTISTLQDDLPIFGNPAYVHFNIHKADPRSIKVLPETFMLKACQSMNVMVVGRYTDTPVGKLVDMTRFFKLDVNGPARQTGPGLITADCFTGDTIVDINIYAQPRIPGLYDPGGGGGGQQTGDISGRVYKPNYTGAGNAPIWLDMGGGQKIYSHCDGSGFHFFDDVPVGTNYSLESSLQGYTRKVKTGVNVTAGENTSVSFTLLSGANFDGDANNDSVDTDDDNDGVADAQEGSTLAKYDPDVDGDGYTDDVDAFPADPNEWEDTDNDSTGDNADTDDDNDGILDTEEVIPGSDGYITDPKLADTDGGGENDGSEVTYSRDPTDPGDDANPGDLDADGITGANETLWGYSASDPDTDDDGLCDGDTHVGTTCVAGEDMDKDGVLDASETDPADPDTDDDGLDDGLEASICTSGRNYDSDGDGLCDGDTTVYDGATVLCQKGEDLDADGTVDGTETDPCDDDTDSDTIPDGYEKAHGLNPLVNDASGDLDGDGLNNLAEYANSTSADNWDSDNDGIPDGYEVAHNTGPNPLNPLLSSDADSDFDSDGIENKHEYWNGTDPWNEDPVPNPYFPDSPGCYYWGESDGDGVPQAADIITMKNQIADLPANYTNVTPDNSNTQDLDADGVVQAQDLTLLRNFQLNMNVGMVAGRAHSLVTVYAPGSTVHVGETCHVTVGVRNEGGAINKYSSGFSVVFSFGSGTGSAVMLGGEGEYGSGTRFDVSSTGGDTIGAGGNATIYFKITGAGSIVVNAEIPACGTEGVGKWVDHITLNPAAAITAEEP